MLPRRRAWGIAVVAMLTMTVSYADRQTLAALAPSVTKALHIDEAMYGWLTSAFSIAYLFATPLAGWWIDRVGARRGLVASILGWSLIAALHAIVPSFGVLFALRLALGIAEGPSFPGSAQTMQRVLAPGDRARGYGLVFSGSMIGAMIAPPLASWLSDEAGWRVAFLTGAAIGLVWLPAWILLTWRGDARAQLDVPPPDATPAPRPPFLDLVRHPMMIRALCAIFAVAPGMNLVMSWGAKILVQQYGLAQGDIGHYLWLPPLALDAGALAFGDLLARTRRARTLLGAGALLVAAVALIPWQATPWQMAEIGSVVLIGGGGVYTVVTADALGRLPSQAVSSAGGIIACAQSLAIIITSPIVGRLVDHYGDYQVTSIGLAAWVVPGALAWLVWPPRELA
ncbi:MAG: MFS transporter [Acidobacteriota bacterium]